MTVKQKSSSSRRATNGHSAARTGADAKQWSALLTKSLHERLPPDTFQRFAKAFAADASGAQFSSHTISRDIADALLRTQARRPGASVGGVGVGVGVGVDPLLAPYAGRLLRLGVVMGFDMLGALLAASRVGAVASATNSPGTHVDVASGAGDPRTVPVDVTETLLHVLAAQYGAQEHLSTGLETRRTLNASAEWMSALVAVEHKAMMHDMDIDVTGGGDGGIGGNGGAGAEAAALRESVGRVAVALADHPATGQVFGNSGSASTETAKKLGEAIAAFTPLLGGVSIQLVNRLDQFRQDHEALQLRPEEGGFDGHLGNAVDAGEIQVGNIVDRPIARGRASLVIYLDALLSDHPRVDDGSLLAYLQLRSKGDSDSATVELVTGAFELLAMVSIRDDTPNKIFLYRTFIINKVPLLMSSLTRMAFMPPNFLLLITQAFAHLHSFGFPSYSAGFGVAPSRALLTDTRREFLLACALHGHIAKDNIKDFTGEDSIPNLPAAGLLTKEGILAEYHKAPQKLEQLVDGLEAMDGNAGVLAEAAVQIMHNLCSSRDTIALKNLCHSLSSKPHAIDTIFLFRNSVHILSPVCEMLNGWKYDDDQGEYQPVYEEFSSCFLFLLACMYRFNLSAADLGVQPENSFLTWIIDQSQSTQPIKDLNEEQGKQLAGWAKGLFELEGISDDVMSTCPPQDFYKLVPTIFEQSLLSRRLDFINAKALENGIELLFEVFLLPCVVFGTRYLANQAWIQSASTSAMLQMMQKFIRLSSKSGQALALHNSVLSMVKSDLRKILMRLRADKTLKQQDVDALVNKVDSYPSYARSPIIAVRGLNLSEPVEEKPENSSTLSELRNTFDKLCSWNMPASMMPSVPAYSHTHDLLLTIEANGAMRVVRALVDFVAVHAQSGMGDFALDVASALVCAHEAANNTAATSCSAISLTLRQALQLLRDDAPVTIVQEPLKTEMIVLMHRQVESQLSTLPVGNATGDVGDVGGTMQGMPLGMDMDMGALDMPQNMGVGSVDMSGINIEMDLDMSGMNMNMSMNMMGMDDLESTIHSLDAGAGDGGATTQALGGFNDVGGDGATQTAAPQAMQDTSNVFPLELDTSFAAQQGGVDDDDDDRRTSVEDIWSGLDF